MKHSFIFKTALSLLAIVIITQTPRVMGYKNYSLYPSFNVVNDALSNINEIKENQSKLHKICRTYNVGKNSISIKTKIHFSGYRKKPELKEEIFHVNTSVINAKSITFVYNKKDKTHMTQTIKGSKENKKIALNRSPNKGVKTA